MKELLIKIAAAKAEIKNSPLKKEGRNDFSKYDYFTPSQIEHLVSLACQNNDLLPIFDLVRNELGVFGKLTIYDTTSGESLSVQMATAIPEIKATNIAQQLGGCVTYTERYLKMSVFGITDNKLDFDTTENTKKVSEQTNNVAPPEAYTEIESCNTLDELSKVSLKYKIYAADVKFTTAGKDKQTQIKINTNAK